MSLPHSRIPYQSALRVALTPLLLLVCWHLVATSHMVSPYLLPSPAAVLKTFITLCNSGELWKHLSSSLARIFIGFTLSCSLGIVIAASVTRFSIMEDLLTAPLAFFRMIPPLSMIPLLILWLGIGLATQLTIIILASFFPIYLNTRDGFRRVTPQQQELAKSLSLSPYRYISYIIFPAAIPSIITGTRLAFGYSWRALIGAELIAAASGLGYMIMNAQGLQQTDVVMVGILTIGITGWMLDNLLSRLINKTLSRRFPEVAS